jgi:hypothetical protein
VNKKPVVLYAFLLGTVVVPILDAVMAYNIARQVHAAAFAQAPGTITHSEMGWYTDKDGDTFVAADIRYRYTVDGRAFEGDRLRFSTANFHTSETGWAERAVRRYPVGAAVSVHYDPRDPAQSLLQPGFGGTELFLIMFMTLFNAWAVGTWVAVGPSLWRRWRRLPPDLPPQFRDGDTTRVRFARHAGTFAALTGLGMGSAIGIGVLPLDASLAGMQAAWAMVAAGAAVLGLWYWRERRAGTFDLVIRKDAVTLPERFARPWRTTVARTAIAGVAVKPTWRGIFGNRVDLQLTEGRTRTIVAWYDEDAANALAAALNDALRSG